MIGDTKHNATQQIPDAAKAANVASQSQSASLRAPRALGENNAMPRRAGDIILDRYLSDASPEKREEARENLRRLVDLIVRVNDRLARENPQPEIRADGAATVDSESPHLRV